MDATTPRLSMRTLSGVRPGIAVPAYDRTKTRIGIVHFGPGAFHRAHQACYIDDLLARNPRWAISAVALRTGGLARQAVAQDLLYTVAELDTDVRYRVVGSLRELLVAGNDREAIFSRLNDPEVSLVTATVTEKGYCLDRSGALALDHPLIAADLAHPAEPVTLVGWITEALARRRAAKRVPFAVMSCDNLVENGRKLRGAVLAFAQGRGEADLAAWIAENVRFPSTMVDSITPAATDELKQRVAQALGVSDDAPVQRERFRQWVVEDILGRDAPDLASVGVLMTKDVSAYELAKLRLLNGAHSTLAYAGLMRGHASVGEAVRDAKLGAFVEAMMREDVVPTLRPGPQFGSYIGELLNRFRNPALTHSLSQIAMDGSQKLPYRILAPAAEALAAGRPVHRFATAVAAWMRLAVREAKAGRALSDPLNPLLTRLGLAATGDASSDVAQFLQIGQVFPAELTAAPAFVNAVQIAYGTLDDAFG